LQHTARAPGLVALACLGALSLPGVPQSPSSAASALAAARRAVSSADAPVLRSLRVLGTLFVNNTDGSKSSFPLELRFEIPSSYLRIERQANFLAQSGFDGSRLLNDLRPYDASAQRTVHYATDQIDVERARMRRLLLGLGAIVTSDSVPESIEREVVDGHPMTIVRLTDARMKALRVGLGDKDHMPLVVITTQSVRLPMSPAEAAAGGGPPQSQVLDLRQWFEDRRVVKQHRLPFLVRTVAGGVELERLVVASIDVNPTFGPRDFER